MHNVLLIAIVVHCSMFIVNLFFWCIVIVHCSHCSLLFCVVLIIVIVMYCVLSLFICYIVMPSIILVHCYLDHCSLLFQQCIKLIWHCQQYWALLLGTAEYQISELRLIAQVSN